MTTLVLGPLLRHVGETSATVWVETDAACEVTVLGHRRRTFRVGAHHYAVVPVTGLEPGRPQPYTVELDGEEVWPLPGGRCPAVIRPVPADHEHVRIAYGSCRSVDGPPPAEADRRAWAQRADALALYAQRMAGRPPEEWPDLLLLLGDQMYAEHGNPRTRAFIRGRRDVSRVPGDNCATFEEFAHAYIETWGDDADVRWLLATVPSAMIFDDHELIDDWNISASWVREIRRQPWWPELVTGSLMAYWLYQHLGNLSVEQLEADPLLTALQEAPDGYELLREHATRWDRGGAPTAGAYWSHRRDVGRVRVITVDSRNGRVLGDGERSMLDEQEFAWLEEQARGPGRHLVIGSSVPVLLPHAVHELDSWCEALAAGAWGPVGAWVGERLRRAADAERWPAFRTSFDRLVALVRASAVGELGPAPDSITLLSGDIHQGYLARADLPGAGGVHSAVWQSVCSPLRFPLDTRIERMFRLVTTPVGEWASRTLARLAGVPPAAVDWQLTDGLFFPNQIATLSLDGGQARVRHECVAGAGPDEVRLEVVAERVLTGARVEAD